MPVPVNSVRDPEDVPDAIRLREDATQHQTLSHVHIICSHVRVQSDAVDRAQKVCCFDHVVARHRDRKALCIALLLALLLALALGALLIALLLALLIALLIALLLALFFSLTGARLIALLIALLLALRRALRN